MDKKTLSKIITEVRSISESLQVIVDVLSSDESAVEPKYETQQAEQQTDSAVTEPIVAEQPAVTKTISFEEVRAALANKARAGFTAEVKALIEKHGASKLSDIDPSEYEAVLAEAEVFGNA